MIWRLAGVVVAIVAAASLRWSSVLSLGTRTSREHSAQLRLSLSARPERVERCRELSDEELARLPAHMRLRTQCEGYSARYRLAIYGICKECQEAGRELKWEGLTCPIEMI